MTSSSIQQQKELKVFNNQFVVLKKLSSGSFGVVFQGEDKKTGEQIALKIEKEESDEAKSLDRESQLLQRLQGIKGIPKLYWSGSEGPYNIMVIQLLGRDLAYYAKHLKRFQLKTLIMLAEQMITILEQCHTRSIIHRDMKPENVLVGRDNNEIYLVDFGISKVFKDANGNHVPFRDGKPFIGTTRYASIGAHKGFELGRVDDLESLGYMLVFLYKGSLPWQNLQNVSDKEKTKVVGKMKMQILIEELCKEMPNEFSKYFEYVKKLQFKQTPDYEYLKQLMRKCASDNKIEFDYKYEWSLLERKTSDLQSQHNSQRNIKKDSTHNKNDQNKKQSKNNINSQSKLKPEIDSEKISKSKSPAKQTKRQSLIPDMQSQNQSQSSQFDFLRPPDPYAKARAIIQRSQERHKSVSSLAPSQYSQVNTIQSSIAGNYQASHMDMFANDTQQQQLQEQQTEKKQDLIQAQNFGFQPLENNDTIAMLIGEDEEGPCFQYQELLEKQVQAQFKEYVKNGNKNKRNK
ncbi:unnamed protein product [Paramecium sonneborni]|uniref:Casein kinase I n=1 Tax=Paramecium sonneborni TaxID=65129 RepID=A0A8S1MG59_9CILI|nr:unnamed protein product [Paramecium sonneborni]